ncbi:hypothetical protein ACROYT_G019981 [Oculina patagonica]
MAIQTFLCCFNIYEGSWVCGLCSLLLGAARVYLQWFNLEFRQRMTAAAREQLQIDFNALQLITILQMSVAAVSIAVSLLLLIGLFKRRRWLLFPWLVWVLLEELFSISVIFVYVAFEVKLKCSVYISDAVMFVISMYFMLCVYSYCKHLRRAECMNKYRAAVQLTLDDALDSESSALLVNRPV